MLLVSAATYVAAVLFFGLMGLLFMGVVELYNHGPQDRPPAAVFFELFWVPVFFTVPLITMRCFAEERRLGTLETLLAAPVGTTEVVLGKFGAAYFLYLLLWGGTAGFFWLLSLFAPVAGLVDPGPLVGGYLFVALSGLLFVALGVWASALTRNQGLAALFTVVALALVVWGPRLALGNVAALDLPSLRPVRELLEYARVFRHMEDFTRGVVDARAALFYLSGAGLALVFGVFTVEAKQLHT